MEEVAARHEGPSPPPGWEHNNKRHITRIVPPVPGLWTCFTHSACVCNEIVSATNRVLGIVPLPTEGGLVELRAECRRLARRFGHREPWTAEEVVASFTGKRARRYQDAYVSLQTNPLSSADARINSFVKAEKFDPFAKENPDPRMISARSPRYNIVIAQYLRPVEHCIYNIVGAHGRQVAKGLNQVERAKLIMSKFRGFRVPVCFSIDCSRWDKHVSLEVLRIEHAFYRMLLPNHPEFDRVLSWQEENRCRTAGGVKYTVAGGRMSGDINTALGNCLLMVLMVRAAMRSLGVKHYDIVDDGDDCLVFVEEADFILLQEELQRKFLQYGQELKIENIARDWSQVVFCQARIVHNGVDYIMVRDWRKVLSQSTSGTKFWQDPNLVLPMMRLLGDCELALSAGVPVLQAYARALRRIGGRAPAKIVNLDPSIMYRIQLEGEAEQVLQHAKEREVTRRAREVFELVFDVPEWEQLAIETILDAWELDTTLAVDNPPEWDYRWEDCRALNVVLPEIY